LFESFIGSFSPKRLKNESFIESFISVFLLVKQSEPLYKHPGTHSKHSDSPSDNPGPSCPCYWESRGAQVGVNSVPDVTVHGLDERVNFIEEM
jgi:hypothetical protein